MRGLLVILLLIVLTSVITYSQVKNLKTHRPPKPAVERENEDEDREKGEDIQARNQFRFDQRKSEDGKIPENALVNAKKTIDHKRSLKQRIPMDAGIWDWTWLGPGNIGGRVLSILVHPTYPDIIWVGSAGGGIWRTDNGGSSWYPVNDFMANLAVSSLAMDPTNSNILYAGTGEATNNSDALPGAGIFKSTDGGLNWNQLSSASDSNFTYVSRIAIFPTNGNLIIAATADRNRRGFLQRSTDGGQTWNIMTGLNNGNPFLDVKFNLTSPTYLLAGSAFDFYISNDTGKTWYIETNGAPFKLPNGPGRCEGAFSQSNPSVVYVSMDNNLGEVWRSTDMGFTWLRRNSSYNYFLSGPQSQGFYDNTIWVDPFDPNIVVVGGIDLWRSNDGCATMDKISDWHHYVPPGDTRSCHADQHTVVPVPGYNGSSNKTFYVGNDGGIQKTTDIRTVGVDQWYSLANGLGITQFYSGSASPSGTWIVGGAQDNNNLFHDDLAGPNQWEQESTGDGGYVAIDYNNNSVIYAEYVFLTIKRSDDAGLSYENKYTGIADAQNKNAALFIAPFVMDPNNSNTIVAGGVSLWKTTDQAENWNRIRMPLAYSPSSMCSAIEVAKGSSNIIWVGYTNGVVSKSTNAGSIWTDVSANSAAMPNRTVTDIAIHPTDPNQVFVTYGGYKSNDVWYTSNGGTSWTPRNGSGNDSLPAIQVNTIRFHPLQPNWVYIGTDLGIFASEDQGLHWSTTPRYVNNEGPVNVEVDELFWQDNDVLIAATHGRGMFKCRPLPTVFVDATNTSGFGNGTEIEPYQYFGEGLNAAGNGSIISVKSGTYFATPVVYNKRSIIQATGGHVIIH